MSDEYFLNERVSMITAKTARMQSDVTRLYRYDDDLKSVPIQDMRDKLDDIEAFCNALREDLDEIEANLDDGNA